MKLTELFHLSETEPAVAPEEMPPEEALRSAFSLLTRGNETGAKAVADAISDCLEDTRRYYAAREEILEQRGLQYSTEAEPWLCVIAAAEACVAEGFLIELPSDCSSVDFVRAVKALLKASGIDFSTDRLNFDTQKNLAAWAGLFNEYAGQSGLTLFFVELYDDRAAMGVCPIADYAEAAETAGLAGVKITCRPC